ncbi:hypothetical protein Lal_00012886 [Lupinus albus]|nr:hypothetical protein Lal_00012886 [Lupinus albus]
MGLTSVVQNGLQILFTFDHTVLKLSNSSSVVHFARNSISSFSSDYQCRRAHSVSVLCSKRIRHNDGFNATGDEYSVIKRISAQPKDDISKIEASRAQGDETYSSSVRSVALWININLVMVCAAVVFGVGLGFKDGVDKATEFFAGYLLEQSLSVDNLFVFVLVFKYFKVPIMYQNRVLSYGIAGAVVFRLTLILLGTATLQRFEEVNLLLAAILLYSSFKLFASEEDESDLSDNFVVKTCQKFIPVTSNVLSRFYSNSRSGRSGRGGRRGGRGGRNSTRQGNYFYDYCRRPGHDESWCYYAPHNTHNGTLNPAQFYGNNNQNPAPFYGNQHSSGHYGAQFSNVFPNNQDSYGPRPYNTTSTHPSSGYSTPGGFYAPGGFSSSHPRVLYGAYYDGNRFLTNLDGVLKVRIKHFGQATPLLLTVAVVELSDIAFAVGLRSLYPIISEGMSELEYLQFSFGLLHMQKFVAPSKIVVYLTYIIGILITYRHPFWFIAVTMLLLFARIHVSTEASLAFVASSLTLGVLFSLAKKSE